MWLAVRTMVLANTGTRKLSLVLEWMVIWTVELTDIGILTSVLVMVGIQDTGAD